MRQLKEMVAFNAWANERFRSTLKLIPLTKLNIETPYGLLIERIVHVFVSVNMWLDRIEGKSQEHVPIAKDYPSWEEIESSWINADRRLIEFTKKYNSVEDFDEIVKYVSLKNDQYESSVSNILIHLSHHQMYHRGQIAMALRQNKLLPVPSTDGIAFFRSQDKDDFF